MPMGMTRPSTPLERMANAIKTYDIHTRCQKSVSEISQERQSLLSILTI